VSARRSPGKQLQVKGDAYHHGDLRRALVDAALELVTEEQDWEFSLREVARRAGVSHNAPYNHFPEKSDLLAAVAAVGFARLRQRLVSAISGISAQEEALSASGREYVRYGTRNPALYRLMFGPALAGSSVARAAGSEAKAALADIIRKGARAGVFAVAGDETAIGLATLAAWSAVHGLTMLIIDGLAGPKQMLPEMIERVVQIHTEALQSKSDRT
jgi:AcrR family transcriptional regulator